MLLGLTAFLEPPDGLWAAVGQPTESLPCPTPSAPLNSQQGRPPPRRGGPELCRVKMESGKPGNLGFLSWFLTVEI